MTELPVVEVPEKDFTATINIDEINVKENGAFSTKNLKKTIDS